MSRLPTPSEPPAIPKNPSSPESDDIFFPRQLYSGSADRIEPHRRSHSLSLRSPISHFPENHCPVVAGGLPILSPSADSPRSPRFRTTEKIRGSESRRRRAVTLTTDPSPTVATVFNASSEAPENSRPHGCAFALLCLAFITILFGKCIRSNDLDRTQYRILQGRQCGLHVRGQSRSNHVGKMDHA